MFEPTESLTRGQRALEGCRFDEAQQAFAGALQHSPQSIDALRGLGYSLLQLGRLTDALDALERALRADPTDLLSRLLMGRLCLRLQQPGTAEEHFRVILTRIRHSEAARSGLVDALVSQGRMAPADAICGKMLREDPTSEVAHLVAARLAGLRQDQQAALDHFETLVRIRPGNASHRYNRGLCLLRMGRFAEGWRDYEFRFAAGAVSMRLPPTPRWTGAPVRRLLVLAEQGLGDTMLFSRFIRDATRLAHERVLMCPVALAGLLRRSLPGTQVLDDAQAWPEHDAHVPLMSLPQVLGLGADAVAAQPAYLAADPVRSARWSDAIGPRIPDELRVGIVHATSVAHSTEENPWTRRSCRPSELGPLTTMPGIAAYNLNLGQAAQRASAELPALRELPAGLSDFDDTAAVAGLMDAVVCVDTAIAHVAGAMGTPVRLLLPYARDWRWMPRDGRLPWYPDVNAFAQQHPGRWHEPVEQLRGQMAARLLAGRSQR